MTVVPGVDHGTVNLLCDRCGATSAVPDTALRDDEVVWPLVVEQGWAGSPFAVGPHQCPSCVGADLTAPRRPAPPAPRRPHAPHRPRLDLLPEAAVVTLGGDVDGRVTEAVRDALSRAVADRRNVIVDMTLTRVIDSAGLGVLVRAQRDAKLHQGLVCLVRPPRFVVTVLHTMRLEPLFPVFDDVERACTWLAAGSAHGPVAAADA